MPKPFMTYEQQIEKLRNKGLIIESTTYAQAVLAHNSYFALIVGYKDLFKILRPETIVMELDYRISYLFTGLTKISAP